ncbi:MAG TPA: DUF5683 domain-containing protein [Chitinophagaceae bacterium]|nr:DUF5683 domain-containing protein [Chitinophagaceae bacterium]
MASFSQRIEPINKDSTSVSEKKIVQEKKIDSATKKIYSPKKAAMLSAIFPGLGQVYNKKYWKLPIVYAAMGISAGIFFYNLSNYRNTRFAYTAKYKASLPPYDPANPRPGPYQDSTDYFKIKPDLLPLSQESLRFYRNQFRRDIDFSAIFFIVMWGLNIVDATVDAHLKAFDVSPDLSLRIKPGHSEMAGTNGISLVLSIR